MPDRSTCVTPRLSSNIGDSKRNHPLCTSQWPYLGPTRPTVGPALEQWFATAAGRGPKTRCPRWCPHFGKTFGTSLGDRYGEYRQASGYGASKSQGGAGSGGCLLVAVLGPVSTVCAAIWP
ncbi:hypothetical protein KAURM247S_04663 [Kitasatospora aureofaciens]